MNDTHTLAKKVKGMLADFVGTEADEIKSDDLLHEDLSLSPADIDDFAHELMEKGVADNIKLSSKMSVSELIEEVIAHEAV